MKNSKSIFTMNHDHIFQKKMKIYAVYFSINAQKTLVAIKKSQV